MMTLNSMMKLLMKLLILLYILVKIRFNKLLNNNNIYKLYLYSVCFLKFYRIKILKIYFSLTKNEKLYIMSCIFFIILIYCLANCDIAACEEEGHFMWEIYLKERSLVGAAAPKDLGYFEELKNNWDDCDTASKVFVIVIVPILVVGISIGTYEIASFITKNIK